MGEGIRIHDFIIYVCQLCYTGCLLCPTSVYGVHGNDPLTALAHVRRLRQAKFTCLCMIIPQITACSLYI